MPGRTECPRRVRLGVAKAQLEVTTRGAIDATGTDEAGWKQDRHVDVQLATNWPRLAC